MTTISRKILTASLIMGFTLCLPNPAGGVDFPVNLPLNLLPGQISTFDFGEQRWQSGVLLFGPVLLAPGDTATITVVFDKTLRIEDTITSEDELIFFRVDATGGTGGGLAQALAYRWVWVKPIQTPPGSLRMAQPFFGTGCLNGAVGSAFIEPNCANDLVKLDITDGVLDVCGIELRVQAPSGVAGWQINQIRFALQADEISIQKTKDIPILSPPGVAALISLLLFAGWALLRRDSVKPFA